MHFAHEGVDLATICIRKMVNCAMHILRPMRTDPILLANNTQHCWAQQCCDLLRPFAWNHNNVGTCCEKFETGQTFRPMQTDATLLANNTQQCWELLALVASVCMGL